MPSTYSLYHGEGKGGGIYGGLSWLSAPRPFAARIPDPSCPPRAGARSAAAVASRAAGYGGTGGARCPLEGGALQWLDVRQLGLEGRGYCRVTERETEVWGEGSSLGGPVAPVPDK